MTPVQITDSANAATHSIEPVDIPLHAIGRDAAAQRLRIIEPGRANLRFLGRDLWRSRELLYFLTWRDIKVRYKQAMLGVLWAVLQPIISMVVLSMVFGRLAGIAKHTGSVPYPVFVYTGLLPWNFFAGALSSSGGNSVISNVALITKIRFPRILIPIAAVSGELVDLGIAFLVLIGLMLFYHVPITVRILLVPFLVMGVAGIALGLGSIFAALTVRYRDFRFIIPFLLQIGMFATPIIYPISSIPTKWRLLLLFNPLTGWISGFRGVLLGAHIDLKALGISAITTIVMLLAGLYFFRASERAFAEVI